MADAISALAEQFFDDSFQGEVDAFITEHCRKFEGVSDEQTEGKDNKYWDTYQEFVTMFEGKLEGALKKTGYTHADFVAQCREVVDSGDEWGENAAFINLLLATTSYEAFLGLMKAEAEEAAGRAARK